MSDFTMRYAIVIEDAGSNYSAYVPDLPGCVAVAKTRAGLCMWKWLPESWEINLIPFMWHSPVQPCSGMLKSILLPFFRLTDQA